MPRLALFALLAFFALAFGWRSWRQFRTTGSTGFRGISGAPGSAEWFGGLLFVAAAIGALLAPLADLAGVLSRLPLLDAMGWHMVGMVLLLCGATATLWSQVAMGPSWRIGVDASERTTLVQHGPFRFVRNPIFSSMTLALTGVALLVPNALSLGTLVVLVVALELQVRRVEEPYLARTHGDAWLRYAEQTGRFVPWLGRLRRPDAANKGDVECEA